jgi:hypothetical protein
MNVETFNKWRGFKYCPATGNFYRAARKTKKPCILNGAKSSWGYLRVTLNDKEQRLGRAAFEIMLREPLTRIDLIDHINGIKTDNRWCNLRKTTARGNQHNRPEHRNGKVVGSYPMDGRFGSCINYNGRSVFLGSYGSSNEAEIMYARAIKYIDGNIDAEIKALFERPKHVTLGYSKHRNKFSAYIHKNGAPIYLGIFATPEGARAAHLTAMEKYDEY